MVKRNRNRLIDSENELAVSRVKGSEGISGKVKGIKKFKVSVVEYKSLGYNV